jgi:hypothetical protein
MSGAGLRVMGVGEERAGLRERWVFGEVSFVGRDGGRFKRLPGAGLRTSSD